MLPNLQTSTHLYLQWNRITVIENFEHLKNLKKLYLGHNEIQKLTGLSHLNYLEELHIERQHLPDNFEFEFETDCLGCISVWINILLEQYIFDICS